MRHIHKHMADVTWNFWIENLPTTCFRLNESINQSINWKPKFWFDTWSTFITFCSSDDSNCHKIPLSVIFIPSFCFIWLFESTQGFRALFSSSFVKKNVVSLIVCILKFDFCRITLQSTLQFTVLHSFSHSHSFIWHDGGLCIIFIYCSWIWLFHSRNILLASYDFKLKRKKKFFVGGSRWISANGNTKYIVVFFLLKKKGKKRWKERELQ